MILSLRRGYFRAVAICWLISVSTTDMPVPCDGKRTRSSWISPVSGSYRSTTLICFVLSFQCKSQKASAPIPPPCRCFLISQLGDPPLRQRRAAGPDLAQHFGVAVNRLLDVAVSII